MNIDKIYNDQGWTGILLRIVFYLGSYFILLQLIGWYI